MAHLVTQWLPLETMLPAPGQGALAVQCRANDESTLSLLAAIEDDGVRTAVTAERAFLSALGGGCSAPIAAYAKNSGGRVHLEALVASVDGRQRIKLSGRSHDPLTLGKQLAAQATAQGADTLLITPQALMGNGQWSIVNGQFPLSGKRILITRPRAQAETFAAKLAALGAKPVVFPVIQFKALPATLPPIETYDWIIFTSVNAVAFFFERLKIKESRPIVNLKSFGKLRTGSLISNLPTIAATGPATAQKLAEYGVQTDFVPAEFTGEALAAGLGDLTGQRVLLPRAKIGRPQLVTRLREQGAEVDEVALYDTVTAVPTPEALAQLEQGIDVITFTSPSSVRSFLEITGNNRAHTAVIACIGPITAQQAQASGLPVHVTPENYTIDGLTEALIAYFKDERIKNKE
jgi:uroporphyrinogen-III synthase